MSQRQSGHIPAIHPRYRVSYQELYGTQRKRSGTFGVRCFIALCLFAFFVICKEGEISYENIGTGEVCQIIQNTFPKVNKMKH